MAIALDTSAQNNTTSFSYTCTGSNLVLVVAVLGDTTDTLTGITYNGVSLSFVQKFQYPGDRWVYLYQLTNPATGSHTLATSGNTFSHIYAASYTGCAQSGQPDSSNSGNSTTTTPTLATTVVAANCWMVGFIYGEFPVANAVTFGGAAGVIRQNQSTELFADSNATVGTGSQSMVFNNNTGGRDTAMVVLSLAPFAASGPTNVKTKDGVTQSTGIKTYEGVVLASVKTVEGVA